MTRLENGQRFPALTLAAVGGATVALPNDLHGSYAAVLVYRGAWCPYCKAQLAAFRRAQAALDAAGVKVVALSVDDERTSTELVAALHLTFPVLHSADVDAVALATGAYTAEHPGAARYLQSTGFVLDPDGTVVTAVYSSGAIGRLLPDDVAGLVSYLREHG